MSDPKLNLPKAATMIFAEMIYRQPSTGLDYVLGCMNGYEAAAVPILFHSFAVYLTLSGGRGELPFRLAVFAEDDRAPLAELTGSLRFRDPTFPLSIPLVLHNITFPSFGAYMVEFSVDGEVIADRPFRIRPFAEGEVP